MYILYIYTAYTLYYSSSSLLYNVHIYFYLYIKMKDDPIWTSSSAIFCPLINENKKCKTNKIIHVVKQFICQYISSRRV